MHINLKKGLDLPISGSPNQTLDDDGQVRQVALLGRDYIGLRPSMVVKVGDDVVVGQHLFTDKQTGAQFTSPGCGRVSAINRGPKRKFESIVIDLAGEKSRDFSGLQQKGLADFSAEDIRETLIASGMWTAFRTRPYGRVPQIESSPASIFVTAIDTSPLAADPAVIIKASLADFSYGLALLQGFISRIFLCSDGSLKLPEDLPAEVKHVTFSGPHPAGLPSTHIHFLDPVSLDKTVWHIGYQDVIALGALFKTDHVATERLISLAGPGVKAPTLVRTRLGANIDELCQGRLNASGLRLLSGSVLAGFHAKGTASYLGRYHQQVSAIAEESARGFLGWLRLGSDRFSGLAVFLSALQRAKVFPLTTAAWGGQRAIFPVRLYDKVMPLDIVAIPLLKSIVNGDAELAQDLGCLELIEEDLALCSFVCPGKNSFGPMLVDLLDNIAREQS